MKAKMITVVMSLFLTLLAINTLPVQADDDNDLMRTPGYWKTHSFWPVAYNPGMTLETVFASTPSELDGTTLLQALSLKGGGETEGAQRILARAAVAALLNAATFGSGDEGYPLSVGQVISRVNGAFNPGNRDSMLSLAEELDFYNNNQG